MRIVHVIRRLQKSAGTSTFCVEACNGLAAGGHDVSIAVCYPEDRGNFSLQAAVKVEHVDKYIGGGRGLLPDVVHIHALWSPFLRKVANWAHDCNVPIIWSTHGLTAPWAMRHKWWKKMPVWWLYQKRHLGWARFVHATTELEAEWNVKLGLRSNVIIPLGTSEKPGFPQNNGRCLLFVGRLYPVKGLDNLLRAWATVDEQTRRGWTLRLIGPDQAGYRKELEDLARRLGIGDSVTFPGPRFGNELSREYDDCDCLVLPSYTENFGATIVDALAHGKPCIASTFTPWKELEERKCGWWVSNEPLPLAKAISGMIESGENVRYVMGMRGRALVEEKYTWGAVVKSLEIVYGKCVNDSSEGKLCASQVIGGV